MQCLVTVRWSVRPDVMLEYCTLKIYVPVGVRAEGGPYHADDGSFVLDAILEDGASWGKGWWAAGIPNIFHHTKDGHLVVPG